MKTSDKPQILCLLINSVCWNSPFWKEGIDNSVSERIDGKLWNPLEIFTAKESKNSTSQHKVKVREVA